MISETNDQPLCKKVQNLEYIYLNRINSPRMKGMSDIYIIVNHFTYSFNN